MKDISQYIKKIHKESNLILKKNLFFYCFFKFYHSTYKEKISNFLITTLIFICLIFSIFSSIFLDEIIPNTNIEFLNFIISFFTFIFTLLLIGFIFMKVSKITIFLKDKFIDFIIKRTENYILKQFSGVDKNILLSINYIFLFIGRSLNDIENLFNKTSLNSDINLSNISYDLILKFEKEEKINKF